MKERIWAMVYDLIDKRMHDEVSKYIDVFEDDVMDLVSEIEDLAIEVENKIIGDIETED